VQLGRAAEKEQDAAAYEQCAETAVLRIVQPCDPERRPPDGKGESCRAHGQEQACEEEPTRDDVADGGFIPAGVQPGGRRGATCPDREREHARDQVTVVRDDPPADAVVALGQARPERDHELAAVARRKVRPACEHRAASVPDGLGSAYRGDRVVEEDANLTGWLRENVAVSRYRANQPRMRER
jgi:hypothetical protein